MHISVHRIELPLIFPFGLSAGENSTGNNLTIARDGAGHPVIRGSTLAGILRSAWQQDPRTTFLPTETLFGTHPGNGQDTLSRSLIEVPDCQIDFGHASPITRTHNQINRHTGSALGSALFSIEAIPPQATTTAVLWFFTDKEMDPHGYRIARLLASYFDDGLIIGAKSNRGIGMAQLARPVLYRRYDLTNIDEHAAWLDDHLDWRSGHAQPTGEIIIPDQTQSDVLVIDLALKVTRGQDFLVGDHDASDQMVEPQSVLAADGQYYLRLPGSTLRGHMRSWINRLAAREKQLIFDSLANYQELKRDDKPYTGDAIGWGFLPVNQRRQSATIDCPVTKLFGSLSYAGRLHISDSLIPKLKNSKNIQTRTHLAIDRITGGSCEGLLFSNQVVTASNHKGNIFTIRLLLKSPEKHEVSWLAKTLNALNLGLIRIGSSKASGRMSIEKVQVVRGPFKNELQSEVSI